jgi:uncharacterized protein (DUF302 family)
MAFVNTENTEVDRRSLSGISTVPDLTPRVTTTHPSTKTTSRTISAIRFLFQLHCQGFAMPTFLPITRAALMICTLVLTLANNASAADSGIVKVKSNYNLAETVTRLKQDVAAKGIKFFQEIDQSKLAADAGIAIKPSTLLVFGNPPLGTLFIKANPVAGLDWPVRLLVFEDERGSVWTAYTDFAYIARRHDISGGDLKAFETASGVIASITSSVAK